MADDIWDADLLDRQSEARFLLNFLKNRMAMLRTSSSPSGYVLNLDARNGEGKTFLLTGMQRELEKNADNLVVYVDAWKDDHASDPLIAVMAAIDKAIRSRNENTNLSLADSAQNAWEITKHSGLRIVAATAQQLAIQAARYVVGEGIEVVANVVNDGPANGQVREPSAEEATNKSVAAVVENKTISELDRRAKEAIDAFLQAQASSDSFRKRLTDFANSFQGSVYILIDELDRCRPTYAIELLERIKHFFDVPGVAFIVATDSSQLQHSIKAVYGGEFNSIRYLKRFFDRSFQLQVPALDELVGNHFQLSGISRGRLYDPRETDVVKVATHFFTAQGVEPRSCKQIIVMLGDLITAWPSEKDLCLPFALLVLFAYQQGLYELSEHLQDMDDQLSGVVTRDLAPMPSDTRDARGRELDMRDLLVALCANATVPLTSFLNQSVQENPKDIWVSNAINFEMDRQGAWPRLVGDLFKPYSRIARRVSQLHNPI